MILIDIIHRVSKQGKFIKNWEVCNECKGMWRLACSCSYSVSNNLIKGPLLQLQTNFCSNMIASSTKGNKRHPLNICIIGRATLSLILYSTYFELIKASPKFWFHLPRSKGFVYPMYYNNIYSIQTLKTIDIYQQYSIYNTINVSWPVNLPFIFRLKLVTNESTCKQNRFIRI